MSDYNRDRRHYEDEEQPEELPPDPPENEGPSPLDLARKRMQEAQFASRRQPKK